MIVWHIFAIVSNGQFAYDNWAYSTVAECEKNRVSLEEQLKGDKRIRSFHISPCDKIGLGDPA